MAIRAGSGNSAPTSAGFQANRPGRANDCLPVLAPTRDLEHFTTKAQAHRRVAASAIP